MVRKPAEMELTRFYASKEMKYGREMSPQARRDYLNAPRSVMGHFERIFADRQQELIPYFRSWTHDQPVLIHPERDQELGKLAALLYRCCEFYAGHYREYLDRISYEENVLELLEMAEKYPFSAGTWRPDFLICEDGSLRVCEITSRFFGNGYFLSYFTEHAAKVFALEAMKTTGLPGSGGFINAYRFERMLEYLAKFSEGKKKLLVLTSSDPSDSIRLYIPFYEALGLEVQLMHVTEIPRFLRIGKDTLIVSAMNQNDILLHLSRRRIAQLLEHGMRNDLRSVFLLHDKRFFSLMGDERFTDRFLTKEEGDFLRAHIVPTYIWGEKPAIWENARLNKDQYILKHRCLGKSEQVYAGCLTGQADWDRLFELGIVKEMILQPFMQQKVIPSRFDGRVLQEYICGTLLTIDDRYFGTGLFRTSSRAVINQADAHKAAGLLTGPQLDGLFPGAHVL